MEIFKIPDYVENLIYKIESAGYEAWLVGGTVRDLLLGVTPHDYDVASSAPCEVVRSHFDHVIDTGLQHGTVTVVLKSNIEVTRYRVDGDYTDHRHPDKVEFTSQFHEDLSRRDFTVNAMGYHPARGVFDPFLGRNDLQHGIIRAVRNASQRFDEDALRIMRAVRFASMLSFSLDNDILVAIEKMAPLLKNVSAERIFYELWRTLNGNKPSLLSLIINSNGLAHIGIFAKNNLSVLDKLPKNLAVRMAVLCYLCNADTLSVMQSLKSDRERRDTVQKIHNELLLPLPSDDVELKCLLSRIGPNQCKDLLVAKSVLCDKNIDHTLSSLDRIITQNEPYLVNMLNISGNDILALGAKGKQVGEVLSILCAEVIKDKAKNKRDILISIAEKLL